MRTPKFLRKKPWMYNVISILTPKSGAAISDPPIYCTHYLLTLLNHQNEKLAPKWKQDKHKLKQEWKYHNWTTGTTTKKILNTHPTWKILSVIIFWSSCQNNLFYLLRKSNQRKISAKRRKSKKKNQMKKKEGILSPIPPPTKLIQTKITTIKAMQW